MNLRMRATNLSTLALLLTASAALVAQSTTGSLNGTVKDTAGAPVADARVTLTSPALFNPRVVVTSANGEWRAPLLPTGYYKVTVTKTGFVGTSAENLRVGIGTTLSQDLVIRSMQVQAATVEVVAESAEMDKTETKTAANFSAEALLTLPGAGRSFNAAADLAPGLVTGSAGSFSMRGGATQNTLYRVNGADVKDDYQGNLTGRFVLEDNIEDIQVILSPLNARNGRATGGQINVVTKSGGNDFQGSVRATLSRPTWAGNNGAYLSRLGDTNDTLNRSYQATFSGPIVKDRLWFSLGAIQAPNVADVFTLGRAYPTTTDRTVRTGNAFVDAVTATDPVTWLPSAGSKVPSGYRFTLFDQTLPYTRTRDNPYFEGKLKGAITQNHTLELSYSRDKVTLNNRNPFGDGGATVVRLAALGTQVTDKKVWGINYTGVLSNSVFLEGRISKNDSQTVFPSGDPAYPSAGIYIYQGSYAGAAGTRRGFGYPFGFNITPTPDERSNRSGNFNVKMFRDLFQGQHEIDFGMEYYEAVRGTSLSSGALNRFYRIGGAYESLTGGTYIFPVMNWMGVGQFGQGLSDPTGLRGPAPTVEQYFGQDGITRNRTTSLYFNDTWTLNSHWNVMLGLRYDWLRIKDTDGAEIGKAGDLSPRLMVRYDLKGDSKHLFTLSIARFGGDFTTGFTDSFIKNASSTYADYVWTGNTYNPGDAADPSGQYGVRFVDVATLYNMANYQKVIAYGDASKSTQVASNLRAPYLDETSIGYRRAYDQGSSFRLAFVHREWKKDWGFSSEYLASEMVTLHDPTGSGLPDKQAQIRHVFNSDDLTRTYNGLEIEFLSKLSAIWTLGGNYTYSRLVGNNNGGDQGGSTFRDNGTPSYYAWRNHLMTGMGLSEDTFAPTGPLVNDQNHRARLHLTAQLPLGKGNISYSWLLRYDSGTPWSAANTAPITGLANLPAPAPAAPSTYSKFYGGRGQYRYNDTYQVDFKLQFAVPLGLGKTQLIGDLQVNNLFNTQLVATYSTALYGPANVLYVSNAKTFGTTQPGSGTNYFISARSVGTSIGLKF